MLIRVLKRQLGHSLGHIITKVEYSGEERSCLECFKNNFCEFYIRKECVKTKTHFKQLDDLYIGKLKKLRF